MADLSQVNADTLRRSIARYQKLIDDNGGEESTDPDVWWWKRQRNILRADLRRKESG